MDINASESAKQYTNPDHSSERRAASSKNKNFSKELIKRWLQKSKTLRPLPEEATHRATGTNRKLLVMVVQGEIISRQIAYFIFLTKRGEKKGKFSNRKGMQSCKEDKLPGGLYENFGNVYQLCWTVVRLK